MRDKDGEKELTDGVAKSWRKSKEYRETETERKNCLTVWEIFEEGAGILRDREIRCSES